MKKKLAIVVLGGAIGAIVLGFLLLEHDRPKPLPLANGTELASTTRSEEKVSHRFPPHVRPGETPGAKPTTNLLTRIANGEELTPLTPEQVAGYLEANHRSIDSLLGAYRTTRDKALLKEAAEKYPNDPRVALEAAYFGEPEERWKWLDAFKNSAPDNSLPSYLSAGDYLKAGDKAHALEEMQAAATKSNFQDYFGDFVHNATEAYRAAGCSEAEAKSAAASQALLPYLASLKQLGVGLVDMAQSYGKAGDTASAQTALDMAVKLGAKLNQPDAQTLIGMLVGIAVQKNALQAFDPNGPYGPSGQSVQSALDALNQQREEIKALAKPLEDDVLARLPEADLINYRDRQLLFGAQAALEWLKTKYKPVGAAGQ
ncbi:MAG TPA: hypothetical protein VLT36_26180 [Candidatus Dormibacteraeota bacterium]|nr:hypothetical protein [Candidatus Dormibacteraeota bacterium]